MLPKLKSVNRALSLTSISRFTTEPMDPIGPEDLGEDDEPVVTAHRDPADWTSDPEKTSQCIDLDDEPEAPDDAEAARKKQKTAAAGE